MGTQQRITEVVIAWPGLAAQPHRFGGVEYVLGSREIGHVHGDYLVDIPFPTAVKARLVAEGRAEPHHLLPDTGWVSFYLRDPAHVQEAIALLRLSYDQAVAQQARRGPSAAGPIADSERSKERDHEQ